MDYFFSVRKRFKTKENKEKYDSQKMKEQDIDSLLQLALMKLKWS